MEKEDYRELEKISTALRQLVNIEAFKIIQSDQYKTNVEKILVLDKLGFDVEEISTIVGTTVGTVRKELSVNKSKRG